MSTAHDDCEIVSTRHLAAPRETVFEAFSDPGALAKWWGPIGFTNTIDVFDFWPGGSWKYTMHGPDGTDYYNESQFDEIVAPERIVLTHLRPMHRFVMTMTYDVEAGGTRITWRMRFDSAEEVARIREFVVPANEQNFDRLAAALGL
jgi:uncharacterized protein YndB with AHSA1/START domain